MIRKNFENLCRYITKIENYEEALNDDTRLWVCHHRLETHKYKDRKRKEWVLRDESVPAKELKALGLYFDRPPEELIFLTRSNHNKLHWKLDKEAKKKLSNSIKRSKLPMTDEQLRELNECVSKWTVVKCNDITICRYYNIPYEEELN